MSNPDTTRRSPADRTPPNGPSGGLGRRSTAISDRHLSKLEIEIASRIDGRHL